MLLLLLVIRSTNSSSNGWYTNRTSFVSTVVCCEFAGINFGNDASRPSILDRGIGRNCLESRAACQMDTASDSRFPLRVQIDAARTTWG